MNLYRKINDILSNEFIYFIHSVAGLTNGIAFIMLIHDSHNWSLLITMNLAFFIYNTVCATIYFTKTERIKRIIKYIKYTSKK